MAPWGGRPPRGPVGGRAARRGAWGGIHWGGDTPKDYTKPRQTIQSPGILEKPQKHYTNPLNIRHRPEILNNKYNITQEPKMFDKSSK